MFHRLDLTLAKGADGRWRPKSAPPGASFADVVPAGGSKVSAGRTVRMDGPGWSVGFDVAGAPGLSAVVASAAAAYTLGDGASLVEQASPDGGVKEAIRLPAAPPGIGEVSYTFALDATGVVPSVDPAGMVVFTTPDGTVVASMPPGAAVDSRSPVPSPSPPLTAALQGGPGSWSLKVTVPGGWLRDTARVFPVVVDPFLQAGRGGAAAQDDAFVYSGYPTTTFNGAGQYDPAQANYIDDVGVVGSDQLKTFLKWNLAPIRGQ